MRAVTARRKLATACPLGVKRSSGLSVRLPVMVTWVSAMGALLGLVVLACCSVVVVVRWCAHASFLGWWVSRCRRGVGVPELVRHGPRLPAGRALLLARPGRPVSPGRLDDGRVKGRRRRSRRDAERAERP